MSSCSLLVYYLVFPARRWRRDFCLRVKLPPVYYLSNQCNHSKVQKYYWSGLHKDTWTCRLGLHPIYPSNIKHRNCD